MLEGPVPIDHKENDKGQSQIHHKERPSASAVLFKFNLHFFTGSISPRVQEKKETHQTQTDIIRAEGAEPKRAVIKSKP